MLAATALESLYEVETASTVLLADLWLPMKSLTDTCHCWNFVNLGYIDAMWSSVALPVAGACVVCVACAVCAF